MINSVNPSTVTTVLPYDTFPGERIDKSSESNATPVVDRKQEASAAKEDVPREQVEKAAEKLNRLMGIIDKRLEFSVHEKSHRVMVKIVDQKTGEVLNEIPPKRILDLLSSFDKMVGILMDKKI